MMRFFLEEFLDCLLVCLKANQQKKFPKNTPKLSIFFSDFHILLSCSQLFLDKFYIRRKVVQCNVNCIGNSAEIDIYRCLEIIRIVFIVATHERFDIEIPAENFGDLSIKLLSIHS
jgi:hypothetical protein